MVRSSASRSNVSQDARRHVPATMGVSNLPGRGAGWGRMAHRAPALMAVILAAGLGAAPMMAQSAAAGSDRPPILQPTASAAPQPVDARDAKTAEALDAPAPERASISGTVQDTNGDLIPGASVTIDAAAGGGHYSIAADDNAAFSIGALKPGIPYRVTVGAQGFVNWISEPIMLEPGQFFLLTGIQLKVQPESASVTVYASTEQIATQQVQLEEQQRMLGVIPNFYVVYDAENAAPLTARLKFKLAMRSATDPVTLLGVALMAGVNLTANTPNYRLGAVGYGQRVGAVAADGFSDILIGGAILPSVLHQDPRYFYKGTGSKRSRFAHALSAPFIARGDNGRSQINVSSLGGDLASSALSMTYYPESNRGAGRVFGTFALATGERMVNTMAQEFIYPRLTRRARPQP